jgi:hypothetical protein
MYLSLFTNTDLNEDLAAQKLAREIGKVMTGNENSGLACLTGLGIIFWVAPGLIFVL